MTTGQLFVLLLIIGVPLFGVGLWGMRNFHLYECYHDERVKYIFTAIALSIGVVLIVGDIIWYRTVKNDEELEETPNQL